MATALDEILARVAALPADEREKLTKEAVSATAQMVWLPNPGPQTDAYFSEADELLYGGEAGGGKSDLLIGLSLTAHRRSLILRRTNKEADKLFDRYGDILGSRNGFNEQKGVIRYAGRIIDVGGCQLEDDKQKRKGIAHDLKGFDELCDFTESQYTFIIGWTRSTDPNQRCRIVASSNPPTKPEGLWIVKRWAAWLDDKHPKPAKSGELRWFTTIGGKDTEVDGPGPHMVEGKPVMARSRTFIRAKLTDNPDLAKTDYDATLAALPEAQRLAYRDGRFDVGLRDDLRQTIPSGWIRAAQARWNEHPTPPRGVPMCAMGVDIAAGGDDDTVLAPRYDGWFAPLVVVPGKQTPLGSDVAGVVVANRRNGATVILDMGGGYGSGAYECLKDNGVEIVAYKGAEGSVRRTKDGKLGFTNKRTEAYWRFREALDPDQEGGSPIFLPPDQELFADLAAPLFEVTPRGIKLETKDSVAKRLGRSPDKADAVIMAWFGGVTIANQQDGKWSKGQRPQVHLGHDAQRRRR